MKFSPYFTIDMKNHKNLYIGVKEVTLSVLGTVTYEKDDIAWSYLTFQ